MKIRQGFVSNSSSSSFIVAINKEGDDQLYYEALAEVVQHSYDNSLKEVTPNEMIEYFDRESKDWNFGILWFNEKVELVDKLTKEGKTFLFVECDRHQKIFRYFAEQGEVLLSFWD